MINKHYKVSILKDGKVTIPAALRRRLGLKSGQIVQQSIQNGKILLEFDLPSGLSEQNQDLKRKK